MEKDQILLDIEAYYNIIQKYENSNSDEVKRLAFLNKQKESKLDKIKILNEERTQVLNNIRNLEVGLHALETKIGQSTKALDSITNQNELNSITLQMNESSELKDEIENQILEFLDKEGLFDEQIKEARTFISGITETILEIENEIAQITKSNQLETSKLEQQIRGLFLELESHDQSLFETAQKKHGVNQAISHISQNACSHCRISLSLDLVRDIKNGKLILCPNCTRLILKR